MSVQIYHIACGGTSTVALSEVGDLYIWGSFGTSKEDTIITEGKALSHTIIPYQSISSLHALRVGI